MLVAMPYTMRSSTSRNLVPKANDCNFLQSSPSLEYTWLPQVVLKYNTSSNTESIYRRKHCSSLLLKLAWLAEGAGCLRFKLWDKNWKHPNELLGPFAHIPVRGKISSQRSLQVGTLFGTACAVQGAGTAAPWNALCSDIHRTAV